MEEQDYGSGIKRYSMSGDEALKFLGGLKSQAGGRDLVNEGARLFQAGDFTGAETKCKEAIAANPNNAVAHGNLGHIYFERKRYQDAIPWLEKALALDPKIAGVPDCLRECRANPPKPVAQSQAQPKSAEKRWWEFWK